MQNTKKKQLRSINSENRLREKVRNANATFNHFVPQLDANNEPIVVQPDC